jgi:DNA-binding transcriptional ArsR family regulator
MPSQAHLEVIHEPEMLHLISDEMRRNIIYALRKTNMSISQLARELHRTPATMHYHMKKLETAGLVEHAGSRVVNNNLTEKYYKLPRTSCIVGFDFSLIGRHGPVPPRNLPKLGHRLDDESINHLFSQLGVTVHSTTQLIKLRRYMRILFDDAATDAMQIFDEIMNQIRLDLSNHDKYKLREVVSIIPSATLCYMLSEQWSREALTGLMEELSSK